MATTIRDNSYTAKPQLAAYRYDQLNRIKQMQTYQSITSNAWGATSTNAYKEVYAYDANGNIKTLERYDGAATPVKIDNLTYGYNKDGNGKLINNRLNYIADPVAPSTCTYDIDGQSPGNYGYDEIGNLIRDNAEGIASIEWNAYGKISKITRAPGVQKSNLEFIYDAMGNRVCKIKKPYNVTSTGWLYTFYVRDASGNIMSTYTKTGDQIEDAVITLDEVMLYGSSRLGVRMVNKTIAQLEAETSLYLFNRRLGLKRYEMSNHLGNVLTTFTDRKYQVQSSGVVTGYKVYLVSAQDYYPFGMGMNERSYNTASYKFGFNGAEKDNETYGDNNAYDFGARIYSPRIGRWLSVDPLFKEYAPISTYVFSLNNSIIFRDKNGEYVEGIDGKPVTYTRTKDGQIEWSSNATDDIKRVCTAMLKTRTGEQVFKDMQKTNYAIGIKISPDYNPDRLGSALKQIVWNSKTNKVEKINRVDIVLYEGNFNVMKDKIEKGTILSGNQGMLYQRSIEETKSIDNALAANLVHEGIHASNKKNIQDATENQQNNTHYDVESLPEEKESQYLIESIPIRKMESRTAVVKAQDK